MRRGHVASGALALVVLTLVGCGRSAFETREPWRAQAEEACLSAKLVQPSAYMSHAGPIDGPGVCGMEHAFKATALASGSVGLTNRLTLACPIIPEIDAWLLGTVQPAAELYLGTTVADLRAGSYSCRPRNNQRGAKLSEHSFGNALDVMAFRLADGREVTVKNGWRGSAAEQGFLREVFVGACARFTTVLGPGSDMFHYDHFHLDLARHNPRGDRRVCKPILKFEPQIDPDGAPRIVRPHPAPRPAEPAPPLEVEEEGEDPYAVAPPGRSAIVARAPEPPRPVVRAPEPRFDPARRTAPVPAARSVAPTYARAEPTPVAPPMRPALPRPVEAAGRGAPVSAYPTLRTAPTGEPLVLQPRLARSAGVE